MTFIVFSTAFDSLSRKFLDEALKTWGLKTEDKSAAKGDIQCIATQVSVQIRGDDGKIRLSQAFDV